MDEKDKILRVMKKYGGYFGMEHRDVAFSTKGEFFQFLRSIKSDKRFIIFILFTVGIKEKLPLRTNRRGSSFIGIIS